MISFDSAWRTAKETIFRLEILPLYTVSGEMERLNKFLCGEPYLDEELLNWMNLVKKTRASGVSVKRVRIVTLPLSNYLRFEIDFWNKLDDAQQVFFIIQEKYDEIVASLKMVPSDYYFFDDKILLKMDYTPAGNFIAMNQVVDADSLAAYRELKGALLESSESLHDLVEHYSLS